mmetsp:Transcript_27486/g.59667  ORF Transcript_27486/g.59667 Transcript_27486/m.59667 type:complete len:224 (-) Transcript_27486:167-838(-)
MSLLGAQFTTALLGRHTSSDLCREIILDVISESINKSEGRHNVKDIQDVLQSRWDQWGFRRVADHAASFTNASHVLDEIVQAAERLGEKRCGDSQEDKFLLWCEELQEQKKTMQKGGLFAVMKAMKKAALEEEKQFKWQAESQQKNNRSRKDYWLNTDESDYSTWTIHQSRHRRSRWRGDPQTNWERLTFQEPKPTAVMSKGRVVHYRLSTRRLPPVSQSWPH